MKKTSQSVNNIDIRQDLAAGPINKKPETEHSSKQEKLQTQNKTNSGTQVMVETSGRHTYRGYERGSTMEREQSDEYGQAITGRGKDPRGMTGDREPDASTVSQEDTLEDTSGRHIYIGQGEWISMENEQLDEKEHPLAWESKEARAWWQQLDEDTHNHQQVLEKGYPNRWGAKIPVKSGWNLEKMEQYLEKYHDKEVVQWLRYGWPTGRIPGWENPKINNKNHKGPTGHPGVVKKYIEKEIQKGAVMGPYHKIPFASRVGISPISTRPKKGTEERRIILDLSFPPGQSVNDGIPKDTYLGFQAKLSFPKVDDFALRIHQLGTEAAMFKIDLSRYFRQLPLDPGDYSLIGYIIEGKIYFDKMLPMGMRSAPYIAQRVTDVIAYIHKSMEFYLLNYVDDFVSAEKKERIWEGFRFLTQLLQDLGVETSKEKVVQPTNRMAFLGITFDAGKQTMEIPEHKVKDITQDLDAWLYKNKATRKELESLIGKLQFATKCVRAGRVFMSRLLNWIRGLDRRGFHPIPLEARKDLAWWRRFLHEHNGVSLMWLQAVPGEDTLIATDASKYGFGGTLHTAYFRGRFPEHYSTLNIAILELKAVMVALKIWATALQGKYFWIAVDNEAVASILNTGASREELLQDTMREIALIAAKHQFVIKARHIRGVDNRVPDWLSRWNEQKARRAFREYSKDKGLTRIYVDQSHLQNKHLW